MFFFFFQKLNKYIYKYSKYKRPRYSVLFRYLPNFRRMKNLLKFMRKSLMYFKDRTFKERFSSLFWLFFTDRSSLFFIKYTAKLQQFIFKKRKRMLLL